MWKEVYKIGVDKIDEQHMALFNTTSKLLDAIQDEAGPDVYRPIISFLKNYTVEHFRDEEDYQELINYKDIDEHREQHRLFTEAILEFEMLLLFNDYDLATVKQLAGTLAAWLIHHVADADQRIIRDRKYKNKKYDSSYIESVAHALVGSLEKVTGLKPYYMRTSKLRKKEIKGDILVEVSFDSYDKGKVYYSFSKGVAFKLLELMTFLCPLNIDEFVCSVLAEISDITTVNGISSVYKGKKLCIISPPKTHISGKVLGDMETVMINTAIGKIEIGVKIF